MRHPLARTSILTAMILLGVNPALAVDRTFQIEVENSLKGTVPPNWCLRASWRDQTLVVFVSPSAQQSFELWYDTPRQKETRKTCARRSRPPSGARSTPTKTSRSSKLSGRKYLAQKTD
jgi:hypothetical protein